MKHRHIFAAQLCLCFSMVCSTFVSAADEFSIEIFRRTVQDGLVTGELYLNGKLVGKCYENDEKKISEGEYPGFLRYHSGKNFVATGVGDGFLALAKLGKKGDFLLEVGKTDPRTNILFHGGSKPEQSKGCILLGPVDKSPTGEVTVDENHPLYKLMVAFYGTPSPNSTPNKKITIKITDIPKPQQK